VPLVFRIEAAHLLAAAGTGAAATLTASSSPAVHPVTADCGEGRVSRASYASCSSYASRDTATTAAATPSTAMGHDDDGPAPNREMLLRETWRWCHQLATTPLMLPLLHRTQQLWAECVGPLDGMDDLAYGPPNGGYA
jgi:hypothetical protein